MRSFHSIQVTGDVRPAVADVAWFDEPFNCYVITRINVPEPARGLGYGSTLLGAICAEADELKQPLALHPQPSGDFRIRQLKAWYTRYGFVKVPGFPFMRREPKEQ